ncbi:MAG: hypothetical protein KGD64_10445, partial [Candidatus Heimdallarchaeota archaeon]|nr:hypothetical protein [Candidatus Heimdallarchaeota archaeon]
IYGYVSVIVSIISFLMFYYVLTPFQGKQLEFLSLKINIFSATIYSAVVLATILIMFFTMVESKQNSEKSFIAFISLLLVQSSTFFIVSSETWLLVFFGIIILFSSFNFYIRYLSQMKETVEKKKYLSSSTLMNSLSLALLFVGISILYFSSESFDAFSMLYSDVWSYLGIMIIFVSLFVSAGIPPFHSWMFRYSDVEEISPSIFLLVIQRGVILAFLSKFSLQIYVIGLSSLLTWLFLVGGIVLTLWGSIGAMTINKLKKLLHYSSLIYMGIVLMLLSNIMAAKNQIVLLYDSLETLSFILVVYVIVFIFSFSTVGLLSKRYKNDDITKLKDLGRRSNSLFLFTCLSYFIIFALPIALPFISNNLFFANTSDIREVLLSINYSIMIIFSLVYMIRLVKWLFTEDYRRIVELNYVEPGTYISFLLSILYLVLTIIFINSFLENLSTIAELLLG